MVALSPSSVQLHAPRSSHSAALLEDGRVLLAGGKKPVAPERAEVCDFDDPCSLASAELVDPDALASTPVASMRVPREAHGAAPVPGGVLVCGGVLSGGGCLRTPGSVERFDIATGLWSDMPPLPGLMAPSTTQLDGGQVLVTGGLGAEQMSARSFVWDPPDAVWHPRADLPGGRYLHAAVLLDDGGVLVAGGLATEADGSLVALASAALYDPRTDSWSEAPPLCHPRAEPSLTLLADGSVLALGGYDEEVVRSAELFHPETGLWTELAPMQRPRCAHTTTALLDGRALIVGGIGGRVEAPSPPWSEPELFDPRTRSFETTEGPFGPRVGHSVTRLTDGRVLIAGGGPETAEVWRPA